MDATINHAEVPSGNVEDGTIWINLSATPISSAPGYSFIDFDYLYESALAYEVGTFLKNNNVQLYLFELPVSEKQRLRPNERWFMKHIGWRIPEYSRNKQVISEMYKENRGCRDYVLNGNLAKVHYNGVYDELIDSDYPSVIKNGRRMTSNCPDEWDSSVYFYGPCVVRGVFVSDDCTISSIFQKIANNQGEHIRSINCGVDGFGITRELNHILGTVFNQNDTAIIINWAAPHIKVILAEHGCQYHELSKVFQGRDEWWMGTDETHFNDIGTRIVSEHIANVVLPINRKAGKNVKHPLSRHVQPPSPEFQKYLDSLDEFVQNSNLKVGAIVMNCNPFTLGHQYLIEYASKNVDKLFIFVVQEDKSCFPFRDRIELVKKGTMHLNNVTVLPSGRFIVSIDTLPEYFNREDTPMATLDASKDLGNFARWVAPKLNIKYRFVGEEPIDFVTNQYNKQMKNILGEYGVNVIEIPRKQIGNEVISASRVRKYLKEGDYDSIAECVPPTTLDYLRSFSGTERY